MDRAKLEELYPATGTMADYYGIGNPRVTYGLNPKPKMEKAEHPAGVELLGPCSEPGDGFQESTRRYAIALDLAGVPTRLVHDGQPVLWTDELLGKLPRSEHIERLLHRSIAAASVRIVSLVSMLGMYEQLVCRDIVASGGQLTAEQARALNKRKIVITMLERDRLVPSEVKALSQFAQVWMPCQRNVAVAKKAGLENVHRVPIPWFLDDPIVGAAVRCPPRAGPVRFYTIGKWEPRKDHAKLLLAFLMAFKPGEAVFIVKTSESSPEYAGYPRTIEAALLAALQEEEVKRLGWQRDRVECAVRVIRQRLPEERIVELHRRGEVYVTLSHAEGYDMPARDAKLAGNILVHTPVGATAEFCDEEDVVVPAERTVPCHPWYGWPGCEWWDYDLEEAVGALRRARDRAMERRKRKTEWCLPEGLVDSEASQVGLTMAELVREVAPELGGAP